ncbi:MAG: DUF2304 domain-containing protein [Bacillota bacterium]|nr:DUF2304 domain-containing protein [Bacillota bacterium]
MTFNVYIIAIIFSIIFLVAIIELVRKNKLLEKYSLLWILFGVVLLILSSTPLFIEKIASVLDIKYAPSVLFLFGMVYLIIYNLHITTVFSKQSQKITRLNQEIALLKEKVEKMEANKEH